MIYSRVICKINSTGIIHHTDHLHIIITLSHFKESVKAFHGRSTKSTKLYIISKTLYSDNTPNATVKKLKTSLESEALIFTLPQFTLFIPVFKSINNCFYREINSNYANDSHNNKESYFDTLSH